MITTQTNEQLLTLLSASVSGCVTSLVLHACLVLLQVDETWSLSSSLELNTPEPEALGELELF